jgi:hypothetical protein
VQDSGLRPLYNIVTLTSENNNYNLDRNKYFYITKFYTGFTEEDEIYYLFNLQTSLRGNYFLYDDSSSRTFGVGFVPNNNFKHYLPFNLKGKAGFDYPSYVTENNYSLNSAGYFKNNVIEDNNGINNSLWICELYKDFDDFEFLGGTSENAIELNTFIPIYGNYTLEDINQILIEYSKKIDNNIQLEFFQSNHEGEIVDKIQQSGDFNGLIINPAAYTHTSVAIPDAIKAVNAAFAPGIGTTANSSSMAFSTMSAPGSEIQGSPASLTKATDFPSRKYCKSFSPPTSILCS